MSTLIQEDRTAAEIHAERSWGIMMVCGECGYKSGLSAFCETDIYGELPPNEYQCPNCQYAFRKVLKQKYSYPEPPCKLEPIGAML